MAVVPQEIFGIISADTSLTQHDLYVLSTVSRAFYAEVKRVIYRSVNLQNMIQIRAFYSIVISQPHLAQGIYKLSLMLPYRDLDQEDGSQLTSLLHLSTKLRDLRLFRQLKGPHPIDMEPPNKQWVLEHFAFKLTTFVDHYFPSGSITEFLEAQQTIKTFALHHSLPSNIGQRPWSALKNLSFHLEYSYSTFDIGLNTDPGRLERSQVFVSGDGRIDWDAVLKRIQILVGKELHVLNLTLTYLKSWTAGERNRAPDTSYLAEVVGRYFPNLKCLEIVAYKATETDITMDVAGLAAFHQLETLVIHPPVYDFRESEYSELGTDAQRTDYATAIIKTLPTLKRLALVNENTVSYEFTKMSGDTSFVASTKRLRPVDMFQESEWLTVEI